MKIIFSSISRLFFSYSKFLSTLVLISTLETGVNASEPKYTYLKCDDRYYRLNGDYLSSNYNIRTKKFKNHFEVTDYKTNYIRIKYGYIIDRNTGEYKNSNEDVICQFEVINFKDLPKVNDSGKLF
ncbi:hypothetical protein N9U50_01935 [Candidatus Pelagibacter sp.]|nr:hypothetical protein [Candidatus Pelagibacter sp.]